jgi:hypothetical protein
MRPLQQKKVLRWKGTSARSSCPRRWTRPLVQKSVLAVRITSLRHAVFGVGDSPRSMPKIRAHRPNLPPSRHQRNASSSHSVRNSALYLCFESRWGREEPIVLREQEVRELMIARRTWREACGVMLPQMENPIDDSACVMSSSQ